MQPILAVLASRATKLSAIVAATLVAGAVLASQVLPDPRYSYYAANRGGAFSQNRDSARAVDRVTGSGRGAALSTELPGRGT